MADDFVAFLDLPQSLRAHALVGSYLQSWAFMEGNLDEAVGIALGLSSLSGAIVCKNIQLRDKIYILKSIIRLNDPQNNYEGDIKALTDISDLAIRERNMIAHNGFGPDEKGDGVRFFVMKAKGKLAFPNVRWSVDDFLDKFANLSRIGKILESISARFRKKTPDLASLLKEPTNALYTPGYPDPQPRHSQDNLGLGLLAAIPRKDD